MARGKYKNRKAKRDPITKKLHDIVETCYPNKADEYKQSIVNYKKIYNEDPFNFDKFFNNDPIYYFYIKLFMALFINDLKALRSIEKISAEELDARLNQKRGYPYASLRNAFNSPTQKNVRIACGTCQLIAEYSHGKKIKNIPINNEFIDLNRIINDSFKYAGIKPPFDYSEFEVRLAKPQDEDSESDGFVDNADENSEEDDDFVDNAAENLEEDDKQKTITNLDDLLFIKRKAQQIYNAKSIDEIIRLANQVLKLSEFLKENA